jgi:hypothetical protein
MPTCTWEEIHAAYSGNAHYGGIRKRPSFFVVLIAAKSDELSLAGQPPTNNKLANMELSEYGWRIAVLQVVPAVQLSTK